MSWLVHDLLLGAAQRFPTKEALVDGDKRITFGNLLERVTKFAAAVQSSGVKEGDRVGIYLRPGVAQVEALLGISLAGGVFVPIHHSQKSRQVSHIVTDCRMSVLVTSREKLAELSANQDELTTVLLVDQQVAADGVGPVRSTSDARLSESNVIDQDLAAILYTSGSTGKPKGVMLSHRNIVAGASIVSEYLKISSRDRILAALPFSFDAGLNQLTTSIQQGATLVLLDFKFAREIVNVLKSESITGLACVPPLWSMLTRTALTSTEISSLRYITNTGGVLPPRVLSKLRSAFPKAEVFLMYGLTEAFRSSYLPPEEIDCRPGSMGKAIPNTELFVVDDHGNRCGPHEVGELVHRGPTVSLGYWGQPQLTSEVIRDHPFPPAGHNFAEKVVYSGDLVRMDEDGYLYFVGRRDNMLKTSGFRVSPTEVEEALCAIEGVQQSAVVGVPDETLGHRLIAFVTWSGLDSMVEPKMKSLVAEVLPNYMVPKQIVCLDAMPTTTSGKVNYPELQRLATSPPTPVEVADDR